MNIKWKYTEKVDVKQLEVIERYFNIILPRDYKNILNECNRGKPEPARFDISNRKECIIDYMINLEDIIKISNNIKDIKMIPIATDPFGNIVGYIISDNKIGSINFWNHEDKDITLVASSFKNFLEKFY